MNEITLTKTVVLRAGQDTDSFEGKLFDKLMFEAQRWTNTFLNLPKERITSWFQSPVDKSVIETELKKHVFAALRQDPNLESQFFINCRNFLKLNTDFSKVKVMVNENDDSLFFVLFFNSRSLFFVRSIGNQLLVTPVASGRDIYQIDMSDNHISISTMEQLLKR